MRGEMDDPKARGVQYVYIYYMMHKSIMVKIGANTKTRKLCKKHVG